MTDQLAWPVSALRIQALASSPSVGAVVSGWLRQSAGDAPPAIGAGACCPFFFVAAPIAAPVVPGRGGQVRELVDLVVLVI